jgi:hypothetical protein
MRLVFVEQKDCVLLSGTNRIFVWNLETVSLQEDNYGMWTQFISDRTKSDQREPFRMPMVLSRLCASEQNNIFNCIL